MQSYDLEDRLIRFAAAAARVAQALPPTRLGNHVAGQLIRCCTSPAPNYGEAQAAESRKDFIHKLRICLKELRETHVWLRILREIDLADEPQIIQCQEESEELIAIFATSIKTATKNA